MTLAPSRFCSSRRVKIVVSLASGRGGCFNLTDTHSDHLRLHTRHERREAHRADGSGGLDTSDAADGPD